MTDEEKPAKTGGGVVEGLTVQGFGGALGVAWVLHEKSHGHFYEAGYELALGTIVTGLLYGIYWLLKPRILKWRGSE